MNVNPFVVPASALVLLGAGFFLSAAAPPQKTRPRPAAVAVVAKPSPWVMTWHDEFNRSAVDATKWTVYDKAAEHNNELQYYAPDDVSIVNGCLRLTSEKRDFKGLQYTSGAVNSKGKFAQAYGRFEARAKLPGTRGIWPAHWLLPGDGAWPPEIDIMELLGHEPTKVYLTNHWGADWKSHEHKGGSFGGPDFSRGFHTFAVEWEPGRVRWFVDGAARFESREGVPDKPFYVILNTAVGGDWPGKPDATTVFPQFHDIDYVRVYKRRGQPAPPTPTTPTR